MRSQLLIFIYGDMAQILGQVTLNEIKLFEVDVNPSQGLGTSGPLGSLAVLSSNGEVWKKYGSANTEWTPMQFGTHYQDNNVTAETSTTSTTDYASKLSLVTPSLPLGNYRLNYKMQWRASNNSRGIQIQLLRNNVEITNSITYTASNNATPTENNFINLLGISGVQTFALNFRVSGGNTIFSSNTSLVFWRTE